MADLEGEVYSETPIDEGFSLGQNYVFWEQYENPPGVYKKPSHEDWRTSMKKVGWFGDIITFWQLWSTLPLSKLENFFFNKHEQTVPIYKVGIEDLKRISSLGVFQSGVKPMWEDPVNRGKIEIRASLPSGLMMNAYNKLWEEFVADYVTHKIPHSEEIAGIRICDKSRGDT